MRTQTVCAKDEHTQLDTYRQPHLYHEFDVTKESLLL